MKKILPVILILTGIAEIMISVMDIRMPVMIAILLGILLIILGVKRLLDMNQKKSCREIDGANSESPAGHPEQINCK